MSTPFVTYTHGELVAAYDEWAEMVHLANMDMKYAMPRVHAWERYCDIRDRLPLGTTGARRIGGTPSLKLVACRATILSVESES